MFKPLIVDNYTEEIFISDELYCNFCVDTYTTPDISKEHPTSLPPCNRCTGLIYAMKSKIYFVIS